VKSIFEDLEAVKLLVWFFQPSISAKILKKRKKNTAPKCVRADFETQVQSTLISHKI